MDPKVSYVLPTFNRVEWIGECMQGLLQQTVKEIELIVVDDFSNDGTDELLDWFVAKDSRVRVIRNAENLGAGRSRNVGNEAALAPIIGVCDSDDIYVTSRTEKILEFFEKNPEPGIMMNAPYMRIGFFSEQKEEFNGEAFDEKVFKETGGVNYFSHPTAAYRKSDIMEIGGYKPETKKVTDDYQLVQDWIAAGKKIGFWGEEFLCGHRVLPNSIMANMRGWKPSWAV